jgi:hypothetical protein
MKIPKYSANAPIEEITAALEHAGCVVVTDLVEPSLRQSVTEELAPHMARARVVSDDDPEEFYPGLTRRVTGLVTRSSTIADELVPPPYFAKDL